MRQLILIASAGLMGLGLALMVSDMSAQESKPIAAETPRSDKAEDAKFRNFEKRLSGTRLTGRFTMSGQSDREPTPETYEILRVEKLEKGDFWRITARIKYGKHDVTVPLAIQVKWAGNTPVMTVDSLFVPGLGTFDARVLFRKNKYSGTWAHGDVGGHLFGTFEKMPQLPAEDRD